MPEPALHTVADHGVAHGPADHETHLGRERRVAGGIDGVTGVDGARQQVHHEGLSATAASGSRDPPQVGTAGETVRRGKHGR
jgi:hypothetical protein